jgi:hypothetical protein
MSRSRHRSRRSAYPRSNRCDRDTSQIHNTSILPPRRFSISRSKSSRSLVANRGRGPGRCPCTRQPRRSRYGRPRPSPRPPGRRPTSVPDSSSDARQYNAIRNPARLLRSRRTRLFNVRLAETWFPDSPCGDSAAPNPRGRPGTTRSVAQGPGGRAGLAVVGAGPGGTPGPGRANVAIRCTWSGAWRTATPPHRPRGAVRREPHGGHHLGGDVCRRQWGVAGTG